MTGDGKQKQRIYASFEQYYITQYKKYFKIIWIVGIDEFVGLYNRHYDAAGVQNDLIRPNMVLSVYVNRKQWKDKIIRNDRKSQCQSFYIELSLVMI